MKCPKCGSEIKDDHLYCDVCGEEIRIVPDFDTIEDEDLKISLTGIIDTESVIAGLNKTETKEIIKDIEKEATKDLSDLDKEKDNLNVISDNSSHKPDNKKIIKALVITGVICVVIVIAFAVINNRISLYYSVDYQYEKAFEEYEEGEYEQSIRSLKRALSIDDSDSRIRMLMADDYYMLSKYDESNAVLYELLQKFPDEIGIYEKIINNYIATCNYDAINKLLMETGDEYLNEEFADYISQDVAFSVPEGSYDEIITLELSAGSGSVIYYTLDGSDVSASSPVYVEPLVLESGEYEVKAMAINNKGIISNVSSAKYTVDFFVPDAPVINTKSGTYNTPSVIDVDFSDYDLCYYTIDGEDPTVDDELYAGPIPMYIGKHTYKFAVITNKGVSSEVAAVEISLDLVTLIDMDTAKNNLITWMSVSGKSSKDFSYKCEQACHLNGGTYYIINEYMKSESDDTIKQTGNHYAVDVLTGLTYRAILDKSTGSFTLEVLI